MIRKILIANRGEIACRIIRTCRTMGIRSVAVYSEADAKAAHVELADEAFAIGPASATESYLNISALLEAAARSGADAVHPGYGFLAENADFAQAVIDAGLVFIGPSPEAIAAMGKKGEAKRLLKDIPLVPGYQGDDQSDATFIKVASEIGYPVMIKASAGGGGKGMRRVDSEADMAEALATARREAKQAFADDTLILEKYILNPRHIEVQVFGDQHGEIIALGERECSIQRRHQKIIEEAPSPVIDAETRAHICTTAVSIAQQLNYSSAGTVEFLLDADRNFYFMEMNTRLQVEHPVTEMIYHIDLVRWQIMAAEGRHLDEIFSHPLLPVGHAVEARLYSENAAAGFLPVTGDILLWQPEDLPDVRIDSGIRTGDSISPYYDPMLAKIIAYGQTRTEALRRLDYALERLRILGLVNNLAFLRRIITHPEFIAGNFSTSFLDEHPELASESSSSAPTETLIAAAIAQHESQAQQSYWRNNPQGSIKIAFSFNKEMLEVALTPGKVAGAYSVQVKDTMHQVTVHSRSHADFTLSIDGRRLRVALAPQNESWWAHYRGEAYRFDWQTPLPLPGAGSSVGGSLRAPMPGQIVSIRVEPGQSVQKGDILLTMEAMKMEHRIQAPYNGIVRNIHFNTGSTVPVDAILLELEPSSDIIDHP